MNFLFFSFLLLATALVGVVLCSFFFFFLQDRNKEDYM